MYSPRLLFLSLLISLCGAAAVAQSSPNNSNSSQPSLALPENSQRVNEAVVTRPLDSRIHILTLQQDEKTCYTIRAYRVARESADSDSTRPVGYSTCQPTTRFQLKQAVDSREVADR